MGNNFRPEDTLSEAQWHLANIKISDGHYKFLTFSSNKSRNHSWFFAPTYDLTADDIRDCFSSTRAIQYLPVYYIKEIPNVVRGIPYEDNNVIALAIKICWIKASKGGITGTSVGSSGQCVGDGLYGDDFTIIYMMNGGYFRCWRIPRAILYVGGYQAYLEDARKRINESIVDRKKPRDVAKSVMDAIIPIKRHYQKLFERVYGEMTKDQGLKRILGTL
ncbi:RNA-dependent RNA polymerase [Rhizophagus clarus]|uniref:RNA-dependent RNA polymerase n=1 Tax=Rhizophagus clarus TaxID=94130 RepID=A0A8H3QTT8_9GLOM|nr:RNA-dependent RNA polymerase [Rhizophagus clarus]